MTEQSKSCTEPFDCLRINSVEVSKIQNRKARADKVIK
jgi:hypothetical protein